MHRRPFVTGDASMFRHHLLRAGLALAGLALFATSLVAALHVAAQENPIESVTLSSQDDQVSTVQLSQSQTDANIIQVDVLRIADLEATAAGKTQDGNKVTYRFRVRNLGPDNAPSVNLFEHGQKCPIFPAGAVCQAYVAGQPNVSLAVNEATSVTFTCTPDPGTYCK